MKRWTAGPIMAAAALGLLLQGCLSDGTSTTSELDNVQAALISVESCGELDDYIRDVALAELDKGIGYYERWVDEGVEPPMTFVEDRDAAGAETDTSSTPSAPQENDSGSTTSEGGTNVQTAGVDEADLVKTDGDFIYVISGRQLRVLQAVPAAEAKLLGSVALPAYPTEMFLSGDTVLVYGNEWGRAPYGGNIEVGVGNTTSTEVPPSSTDPAPSSDGGSEDRAAAPMWEEEGDEPVDEPTVYDALRGEVLTLTLIDVSDRNAPAITKTMAIEGGYASARMVGTTAYTVVRGRLFLPGMDIGYLPMGHAVSSPGEPVQVDTADGDSAGSSGSSDAGSASSGSAGSEGAPMTPDSDEPRDTDPIEEPEVPEEEIDPQELIDAFKQEYKEALDAQSVADWLPRYATIQGGSLSGEVTTPEPLTSCQAFYRPSIQMGLQTLSIIALDLSRPTAAPVVTTTLGDVHTVYASSEAIYTSNYVHGYWFWGADDDDSAAEFSLIHKFALRDGGVRYAASGTVDGQILNQFSLDEHEGFLRVATTTRDWRAEVRSTNAVNVLAERAGALEEVGRVGDLAANEEIFSARFIGPRGYVVTFERVDPLFTLDLSDPRDPRVAGELKIPGFSTYIHPLGANHLLTIGRDTEDNGDWVQIAGVQLQIFDVSDISAPTLAHKATLESGTESEALYEHKAFSYFPEIGRLAIPFSSWGRGGGWDTPGGGGTPNPTDPASGEPNETEPAAPPCEGEDCADDEGEDAIWPDPSTPDVGVMVFAIDTDAGIEEVGVISHNDMVANSTDPHWNYRWNVQVRRTLLIEDALYTVGTAGVKVNAADDLSSLAVVRFPAEDLCGGWEGCYEGGTSTDTEPPTP